MMGTSISKQKALLHLFTRKKRKILHAQGQNFTITFSEVAHFTITFSKVLIVQDYTMSTLRLSLSLSLFIATTKGLGVGDFY